jgi:hypothetical protein
MKSFTLVRLFLVLSPLMVIGFLSVAQAQEPAAETKEPVAEKELSGHEILEKSMKGLKRNMRTLGRNLSKAESKTMCLESIRLMQGFVLAAFPHCPEPFDAAGKKDPVQWEFGFRRRMVDIAKVLLDLEEALQADDSERIEMIWDKIRDLKKDGHNLYQEEED